MLRRGVFLPLLACVSCASKRPPPPADFVEPVEAGEGGLRLGPPGLPPDDAGNLCGRLKIPIVIERPNLYFVLDASGSMSDDVDIPNANGFIPSRYDAARQAIQNVLLAIGHRVSYGAALFPALDGDAGLACLPGGEVFATRPGDPVSARISGMTGNVLQSLHDVLASRAPFGGTPTAATLRALEPEILGLHGKTYVVLLTDGAPNCNAEAAAGPSDCSINIAGSCSTDPRINCCDPRVGGARTDCVDGTPTLTAIADYATNDVPIYVIGMPGAAPY